MNDPRADLVHRTATSIEVAPLDVAALGARRRALQRRRTGIVGGAAAVAVALTAYAATAGLPGTPTPADRNPVASDPAAGSSTGASLKDEDSPRCHAAQTVVATDTPTTKVQVVLRGLPPGVSVQSLSPRWRQDGERDRLLIRYAIDGASTTIECTGSKDLTRGEVWIVDVRQTD